jgi:WD40 repeat protein
VALSADGRRAVSGSGDKTVRVWDLESDEPPRVLEGHSNQVNSVMLSADGRRAVSGSSDKTVRVWDLEKCLCLSSFTCGAPVLCCAWVGDRIAAGDVNGKLHLLLWEE